LPTKNLCLGLRPSSTVSWKKYILHISEKRKGYGRKLLAHIEKNAKAHGANTMKTSEIGPCSDEAISFFISMGYELKPIVNGATGFLRGTKRL
jgi:hypothetical protein